LRNPAPLASLAAAALTLALGSGCDRPDALVGVPSGNLDGPTFDGSGFVMLGAPLLFAPTSTGFGLNVVMRMGDPQALQARIHDETRTTWTDLGPPASPAPDIAQWTATGLAPGHRYVYEVRATRDGKFAKLYAGTAVTAPPPGATFTFDMLADSHIEAVDTIPDGLTPSTNGWDFDETTLGAVAKNIQQDHPDFMLSLGDLLDYHIFGFNTPPPDTSWPRGGMLDYRRMFGDTLGSAAHFTVIGNWDGESGCDSPEDNQLSMSQRLLYLPGPTPETYPEGGSVNQDYYAFTWGDALFVVLNVMTYTPTCHLLDYQPGVADDWTLGAAQLDWLRTTLASSTAKWKFTFIHHTVGGAAGDATNSAYGRGGGQAAHVGEQDTIHKMLMQYGVQIFFYAHDHVFTDMVVDGIHYTLPGSAGAPWKFTMAETGYTNYLPDSGHGRVVVAPESVTVDFISQSGQRLDGYVLQP
jgi:hypothetical protein